jgi:hypothetical protein
LDLGPNLAVSIAEISEAGITLVVKEALEPEQKVSVGLEGQTDRRPTLRVGRVEWCLPTADNTYCVGIEFDKTLPYSFVLQVSRLPTAPA